MLRLAGVGAGRVLAVLFELVLVRAPCGCRERAGVLAGEVDSGRLADPERPRPLLQRAATGVGDGVGVQFRAEVVEEHV